MESEQGDWPEAVITATYEVKVQADGGRWRAQYRDVVRVDNKPEWAVAAVLHALALRMGGGNGGS